MFLKLKVCLSIVMAKAIKLVCKVLNKGGTAVPGTVAQKMCPNILDILSRNVKCIVVTGSNGKTTACRMVEQGLKEEGLNYFANRAGANLKVGIITEFILNSNCFGKCKKEYAVLECDEAATKEVCKAIQPEVIYITNIFKDQVDRFGGVENTRDQILIGIQNAPNAIVCVNADDLVSYSLKDKISNQVITYGLSEKVGKTIKPTDKSDVDNCIKCGKKIDFSYRVFSHLGHFVCKNCGYEKNKADYEVEEISSMDISSSQIIVKHKNKNTDVLINLPALYNIYNAVGAMAALESIGVTRDNCIKALANFKGGFGRQEKLSIGKKGGRMILVKNSAGCDQAINFLKSIEEPFALSLYINNNVSDGVDISWLEDTNFEGLKETRVDRIICSGLRTDEIYDRLLNAGIEKNILKKEKNCQKLISELNDSEDLVIILPTYTGMMESRNEIIKQCGGSNFWEG